MAANLMSVSGNITEYFNLGSQNKNLAAENARLRKLLSEKKQIAGYFPAKRVVDTALLKQYQYVPAEVVKNSVQMTNNYITINKGKVDGIEKGMGVVSHDGIVGIVKSTTNHFATITSLLHSNLLVSSVIQRTGDLCSTSWDGRDYKIGDLRYVPRHIKLNQGDTISTSGFNAIFERGTLI